jgi:hypothetical protein
MMTNSKHCFYNDLSPEEQERWDKLLRRQTSLSILTPLTHTAYLYHPVTYVFCEQDEALPHFLQKSMVQTIEESTGIKFQKETWDTGHSPYIGHPERLLELVRGIDGS